MTNLGSLKINLQVQVEFSKLENNSKLICTNEHDHVDCKRPVVKLTMNVPGITHESDIEWLCEKCYEDMRHFSPEGLIPPIEEIIGE